MSSWTTHLLLAVMLLQPLVAAYASCCPSDAVALSDTQSQPINEEMPCHGDADAGGSGDNESHCSSGAGCAGCQAGACGHAASAMATASAACFLDLAAVSNGALDDQALLPAHILDPLRPPSIS